ncbi:MAG: hypothetical protein EXX96DRAFT_541318 [Benjaminiella poitrasii]|nr:MAG: hypothetical protein EXX96DRAFT_541318 [Benjaminiella poitrasii]
MNYYNRREEENGDYSRKLPSISNLLRSPSISYAQNQYTATSDLPVVNLSPASPVLPSTPPHSGKSPSYLSSEFSPRLPSISPILSPISSPSNSFLNTGIQQLSLNQNSRSGSICSISSISSTGQTIPPIQGDDPPQRLRLPTSPAFVPQPISPKNLLNESYTNQKSSNIWGPSHVQSTCSFSNTNSNASSYSICSSSFSTLEHSPRSRATTATANNNSGRLRVTHSATPSPPHRSRSVSTSSVPITSTLILSSSSSPKPPTIILDDEEEDEDIPKAVPSTQIVFDSSGQPKLKRRRGRPPVSKDTTHQDQDGEGQKSWTFLTPTVWDIYISEEQKEREVQANQKEQQRLLAAKHERYQLSSQTVLDTHVTHNDHSMADDHLMNDSMAAFTNSKMDTILQMPRKKRGRKPKTHIAVYSKLPAIIRFLFLVISFKTKNVGEVITDIDLSSYANMFKVLMSIVSFFPPFVPKDSGHMYCGKLGVNLLEQVDIGDFDHSI